VTVRLFPFRYSDARTGRWIKARYKATPEEIAVRHTEWEITGPAELRSDVGGAFNPYRIVPHAELRRSQEVPPEINPHLARPLAVDTARMLTARAVPASLCDLLRSASPIRGIAGSRAVVSRDRCDHEGPRLRSRRSG
jgi:hypothetical protein